MNTRVKVAAAAFVGLGLLALSVREGEHFVRKEHPGRGYWQGGEWHNF